MYQNRDESMYYHEIPNKMKENAIFIEDELSIEIIKYNSHCVYNKIFHEVL